MPVQFLTVAERARLSRFPAEIPPQDLTRYFTLSATALEQIHTLRGDHNRLGFALQLCGLTYLGFAPDGLMAAPSAIVTYLAQQLGVDPAVLADYGERAQTRTDHLREIQAFLGYTDPSAADLAQLGAWLVERALEHDKPSLLLQLAAEKLHAAKQVRPGITRLERLVSTARDTAQQETYRRLDPLLTAERRGWLDALLDHDPAIRRTRLDWLRQEARANTPRAILGALDKLAFVRAHGMDGWDLSVLTPNRRQFLAQLGRKLTPQALQRAPAERRYPILVAVVHQALEDHTDEAVDLYDRYLAQAYRKAARGLAEFRQQVARSTNEKVRLLQHFGRLVLDPTIANDALRDAIYGVIAPDQLRAVVAECAQQIRPADDPYFDFLAARYPTLRSFAPAFLQALPFHANGAAEPLLQAVELLRQLNRDGKRKLPADTDLTFVPARWQRYVVDDTGQISRRYYELCVLWELRNALRAGDIWLDGSRRYANPASYLIPPDRWPALRAEVGRQVGMPETGRERLAQRQADLTAQLTQLEQSLAHNALVRLERGSVVVTPLHAEDLPASTLRLQQQLSDRLPRVDLADLLIEVDGWTDFSQHFDHAGGAEPRTTDLQAHLYAAILAQACNFGLSTMAALTDFSYRRLAWCSTWYVREETLRAAVTTLVNYHHHLELSRLWGGGTLSSSDGQRFPVAVQNRQATALPRYFGYGRGLTFYSWTSDQFSQYGSKVIPTTVRDATYVLDEILDNATELPILEHTTDTAGFTELVFGLFDLLGLQFAPRIRDLGDQRLYRLKGTPIPASLEPLFSANLREDLFLQRWDDLLRLAGSLKLGWVTASLLIGKLQAYPRQNAVTRALQEYGRLVKTQFILRYLESEAYRRRIETQLNKGEALHGLRRFLCFAHEGQLRWRQSDGQAQQASCLNLVTNAAIVWNTVYMAAVVEQLRAEGQDISDADLVHLSPARYEHINPYGQYRFDMEASRSRTQLRPLRPPSSDALPA